MSFGSLHVVYVIVVLGGEGASCAGLERFLFWVDAFDVVGICKEGNFSRWHYSVSSSRRCLMLLIDFDAFYFSVVWMSMYIIRNIGTLARCSAVVLFKLTHCHQAGWLSKKHQINLNSKWGLSVSDGASLFARKTAEGNVLAGNYWLASSANCHTGQIRWRSLLLLCNSRENLYKYISLVSYNREWTASST